MDTKNATEKNVITSTATNTRRIYLTLQLSTKLSYNRMYAATTCQSRLVLHTCASTKLHIYAFK